MKELLQGAEITLEGDEVEAETWSVRTEAV
jgi:hypothetical protein